MVAIWSPETKFRIWFEIEAHACDAQAEARRDPEGEAPKAVWKAKDVEFDVARIDEIERETKHDVIAFLTHLAEIIGNDEARFVHQGMTSSDVLDTCFNVQLVRPPTSCWPIMDALLAALKRRAYRAQGHRPHRPQPRHPRRAGDLGPENSRAYAEMDRNRSAAASMPAPRSPPAPFPAPSAPSPISTRRSRACLRKLGLTPEPISTQVIPRDRHAMFFATLGVIASSIENIATEIRHMQRTEVLEAEEFSRKGQKGSSAMPHKRNPVLTENLTGLARLVRMAVIPAMENVALWHERDISHSSVERMIGPDATVTLDFALARLTGVIDKLVVYPENGCWQHEQVPRPGAFAARAAGADPGRVSREDAYRLVQRNAMKVWNSYQTSGDSEVDFLTELLNDEDVRKYLSETEIRDRFDLGYHTKHVDTIFARVFKDS
jgi:adenylosuccinate lyase